MRPDRGGRERRECGRNNEDDLCRRTHRDNLPYFPVLYC